MFSRSLLALIKAHEFSLFGGITGWPENVYDRDFSGQYDRRGIRMPLHGSAELPSCEEDFSSTSYVFEISDSGTFNIKAGLQD